MITLYTLLAGFAVLLTQIGFIELLAAFAEDRDIPLKHDTDVFPDHVYDNHNHTQP